MRIIEMIILIYLTVFIDVRRIYNKIKVKIPVRE